MLSVFFPVYSVADWNGIIFVSPPLLPPPRIREAVKCSRYIRIKYRYAYLYILVHALDYTVCTCILITYKLYIIYLFFHRNHCAESDHFLYKNSIHTHTHIYICIIYVDIRSRQADVCYYMRAAAPKPLGKTLFDNNLT